VRISITYTNDYIKFLDVATDAAWCMNLTNHWTYFETMIGSD